MTREVRVWGLQLDIDIVIAEFRVLDPFGWDWLVGLANPGTSDDYDEWWARHRPLRLTIARGNPALGRSGITGHRGERQCIEVLTEQLDRAHDRAHRDGAHGDQDEQPPQVQDCRQVSGPPPPDRDGDILLAQMIAARDAKIERRCATQAQIDVLGAERDSESGRRHAVEDFVQLLTTKRDTLKAKCDHYLQRSTYYQNLYDATIPRTDRRPRFKEPSLVGGDGVVGGAGSGTGDHSMRQPNCFGDLQGSVLPIGVLLLYLIFKLFIAQRHFVDMYFVCIYSSAQSRPRIDIMTLYILLY